MPHKLKRNGRSQKIAAALQSANRPTLIPPDGIYNPEQLCDMLNLSRQALGYHMNQRDPGRQLRFFKRLGDKTHYVTAVEFYRFLIVHGFLVPASLYTAIKNFNAHYGEAAWKQFQEWHESNTSGIISPQPAGTATAPSSSILSAPHTRRKKVFPTPPPFIAPTRLDLEQLAINEAKRVLSSGKPIEVADPSEQLEQLE